MKKFFKTRFGYDPAEVFYGKPNGSLIYAGPITGIREYTPDHPAIEIDNLQIELF